MKLNFKTQTECYITNPEEVLKDILEYYMPYNRMTVRGRYKVEDGSLYWDMSDRLDSHVVWEKKRDLTRREILMWELLGELYEDQKRTLTNEANS